MAAGHGRCLFFLCQEWNVTLSRQALYPLSHTLVFPEGTLRWVFAADGRTQKRELYQGRKKDKGKLHQDADLWKLEDLPTGTRALGRHLITVCVKGVSLFCGLGWEEVTG